MNHFNALFSALADSYSKFVTTAAGIFGSSEDKSVET